MIVKDIQTKAKNLTATFELLGYDDRYLNIMLMSGELYKNYFIFQYTKGENKKDLLKSAVRLIISLSISYHSNHKLEYEFLDNRYYPEMMGIISNIRIQLKELGSYDCNYNNIYKAIDDLFLYFKLNEDDLEKLLTEMFPNDEVLNENI